MNRTQSKQVVIRMTEKDYASMKERIKKSGMNQAEYLRQCILKKNIVSAEGVKELIPELKRIGNNVNQLARGCNAGFIPAYDEVKNIGEGLSEVWRLLKSYLQGQV